MLPATATPPTVTGWDALIADVRGRDPRTRLLLALEQPIPMDLLVLLDHIWDALESGCGLRHNALPARYRSVTQTEHVR